MVCKYIFGQSKYSIALNKFTDTNNNNFTLHVYVIIMFEQIFVVKTRNNYVRNNFLNRD